MEQLIYESEAIEAVRECLDPDLHPGVTRANESPLLARGTHSRRQALCGCFGRLGDKRLGAIMKLYVMIVDQRKEWSDVISMVGLIVGLFLVGFLLCIGGSLTNEAVVRNVAWALGGLTMCTCIFNFVLLLSQCHWQIDFGWIKLRDDKQHVSELERDYQPTATNRFVRERAGLPPLRLRPGYFVEYHVPLDVWETNSSAEAPAHCRTVVL
jgi:hypothetical protein